MSGSASGNPFGAFGAFIVNAAACAGRVVGEATELVGDGLTAVSNLAAQIPIVGSALHGVLSLASSPLHMTDEILKGENIGKALVDDFRQKITAFREVAPLAKTILSFTGVGSGIIVGLSMATAICDGTPITEAIENGIADAIPGGAIARAAMKVTSKAINGDNIIDASVGLGAELASLPPEAVSALHVVSRAAQGDNIPMAALAEARAQLPPAAQKAMDIGIALGQGKKIQLSVSEIINTASPSLIEHLRGEGLNLVTDNPVYKAGRDLVTTIKTQTTMSYQQGLTAAQQKAQSLSAGFAFDAALGLVTRAGVNENTITSLRAKFEPKIQVPAFDLAVSIHIGTVTNPVPGQIILVRNSKIPVDPSVYQTEYYTKEAAILEDTRYYLETLSRQQYYAKMFEIQKASTYYMNAQRAQAIMAYYARLGMHRTTGEQAYPILDILSRSPAAMLGALSAHTHMQAAKDELEKILHIFGL